MAARARCPALRQQRNSRVSISLRRSRQGLPAISASRPFVYHHAGDLATIGKRAAVTDFGWIKLKGYHRLVALGPGTYLFSDRRAQPVGRGIELAVDFRQRRSQRTTDHTEGCRGWNRSRGRAELGCVRSIRWVICGRWLSLLPGLTPALAAEQTCGKSEPIIDTRNRAALLPAGPPTGPKI